jgi:hypothetical protein
MSNAAQLQGAASTPGCVGTAPFAAQALAAWGTLLPGPGMLAPG